MKKMNFTEDDIKEIKRQDKLIHTTKISEREHGLKDTILVILINEIMLAYCIVLHFDVYKGKCKFSVLKPVLF